jgi:hypothetical protein
MRDVPFRLSRRQLFALAGAAARIGASEPVAQVDFWNSKPAEEWSTADIYRLANRSPWANPVQSWTRIQPYRGGGSAAGGNPWPPSPEWGPKGVITWESARPIRDALKTPLPFMFANHYVIGVDGIPLGNTRNPNYLRQFTVLRCKSKAKWSVRALVAHELVRNSVVYAFGFSRAGAPIDPDTEEVVFEAEFGRWMIQTKFKPKDMLYHGQLAL